MNQIDTFIDRYVAVRWTIALVKSTLAGAVVGLVVWVLAYGQGLVIPPLLGEAGSNPFWASVLGTYRLCGGVRVGSA